MIAENTGIIRKAMSEEQILEYLRIITGYHRVQASPDIRNAEQACLRALAEQGVDAQILSYDASFDTRYFEEEMFPEWQCRRAWLALAEPEEEPICDFARDNMCVIMRSASCDFSEAGLELVCLPEDADRDNCAEMDLKGRLILVSGYHGQYLDWAVRERGAVGILSDYLPKLDGLRNDYDMAECRVYKGVASRNLVTDRIFGFSLKKSEADRLRRLYARMEKEHAADSARPRYPRMKGLVETEFRSGELCDLFAEIPGTGDEAVLATAHICHPKPSANDNASGSAGCMELIAVLSRLIREGKLPKPRRSIRILLVPEITGTIAYLANLSDEERRRIKACVNLDMIGGRQGKDAGPVNLIKTPDASASFIDQVAELVLDEVRKDFPTVSLRNEYSSMHHFEVHSYCGGSDHQVSNDPAVGIPTVSFTQWPDRFYHTSFDTPDRIDASLIAKTAAAAAAVLYTLAAPGPEDFDAAFLRCVADAGTEMSAAVRNWLSKEESHRTLEKRLDFICVCYERALDHANAFTGEEDVLRRAKSSLESIRGLRDAYLNLGAGFAPERPEDDGKEPAGAEFAAVYERLFKGGVNGREFWEMLKEEKYSALREDMERYPEAAGRLVFWIDGRRSIAGISDALSGRGAPCEPSFVKAYLELLRDMGLVREILPEGRYST